MRSHSDIVLAASVAKVHAILPAVSIHTVRSWATRDSIPGEYWAPIAGAGIATLDELAAAAAARRGTQQEAA